MAVKIQIFKAKLYPEAQCMTDDCRWSCGPSTKAKNLAKAHIRRNPSHHVEVVLKEVTTYWSGVE